MIRMAEHEIPEALNGITPRVGSRWHWEPLKPHASEEVVVTAVKWNGEEVWVESEKVADGKRYWNELSRWVEATVHVAPPPDEE